jgi:hypothetical protein
MVHVGQAKKRVGHMRRVGQSRRVLGVAAFNTTAVACCWLQGDQDSATPKSNALKLVDLLQKRAVAPATSSRADNSTSSSAAAAAGGGDGSVVTEYVEFAGCGHLPMEEMAQDFNAVVKMHLLEQYTEQQGVQGVPGKQWPAGVRGQWLGEGGVQEQEGREELVVDDYLGHTAELRD